MDCDEDTIGIRGTLEALHRLESCLHSADVVLQRIRGRGNTIIKEVLKCKFRRAHESPECLEKNGVDTEDVVLQMPLEMMETLVERPCVSLSEEMLTVAVEDAFGSVARGIGEPAQLQTHTQIPQQVHMAPLREDLVFCEDSPQSMQAIGRSGIHDDPANPEQPEHAIVDRRGFLAGMELPGDEARIDVPDQVLAILLPADGETFPVHDDDAGRGKGIRELQPFEFFLQLS